jgi:hypothetical protein
MPGFLQYLHGRLIDTTGMTHTTAYAVEVIAAVALVAVALWMMKKAMRALRR